MSGRILNHGKRKKLWWSFKEIGVQRIEVEEAKYWKTRWGSLIKAVVAHGEKRCEKWVKLASQHEYFEH